jgi:hypothetical protein
LPLQGNSHIKIISGIISETIGSTGNVRLLIEIEGFRHMEPEVLLEKLRFATEHARKIDRMAVLSNRIWIKSWVKVGGLITDAELEYFDRYEMGAAWEWVRG